MRYDMTKVIDSKKNQAYIAELLDAGWEPFAVTPSMMPASRGAIGGLTEPWVYFRRAKP